MIPCIEVIHQLWDYLDGELSPERADAIRSHLEVCAGCRAVSEYEEAFLTTVRGLVDDPPPDEELRHQVIAALERHGYRGRPE